MYQVLNVSLEDAAVISSVSLGTVIVTVNLLDKINLLRVAVPICAWLYRTVGGVAKSLFSISAIITNIS